jgi:hypothetical protein
MKALPYLFTLCSMLFTQMLTANNSIPADEWNEHANAKVVFIENKGQIKDQHSQSRPDVLYYGEYNGLNYHLKADGMHYQLRKASEKNITYAEGVQIPEYIETYRVDINWLQANKNVSFEAKGAHSDYLNFYNTPNPETPALFVKKYAEVVYKNIYNGIDVHFHESANGGLEYDFILQPGANPNDIQIEINGAELSVSNNNELVISTPFGDIIEGSLKVFQQGKELNAKWIVKNNIVTFDIENHNPLYAMVIDPPVRIWGTYYGGSTTANDNAYNVSIAPNNDVYITGNTATNVSIATTGAHQATYGGAGDAYLAKFNRNGTRLWATYYGGTQFDIAYASATATNAVFITGSTSSTSGISTSGAYQATLSGTSDAFLVRFNANGVRQWGTYFGGTGTETSWNCAVDATNQMIYITGSTTSNSNIATSGAHQTAYGGSTDAFFAKFNFTGAIQWATYYGGAAEDIAFDCAVDTDGSIFIAGRTSSTASIATSPSYQAALAGGRDGFFVKFNSGGTRLGGSYYGGAENDEIKTISLDINNNIFIGGLTFSTSGIATTGSFLPTKQSTVTSSGFLVRFNPNVSRQWATYLVGINGTSEVRSIATTRNNTLFIGGIVSLDLLPPSSTLGTHQPNFGGGNRDAFFGEFTITGTNNWLSYFGGNSDDEIHDIAFNISTNELYLAGQTRSPSNIATTGSHQATKGGETDAFLAKFLECPSLNVVASANSTSLCDGDGLQLLASPSGLATYSWTGPNGFTSSLQNPTISSLPFNNLSRQYNLVATDTSGCSYTSSVTINVFAYPTVSISVNSTTPCQGQNLLFSVSGSQPGDTYNWSGPNGFSSTASDPAINNVPMAASGTYNVTLTRNGCSSSASIVINVRENLLAVNPSASQNPICEGASVTLSAGITVPQNQWTGPNGFSSTLSSPTLQNITSQNAGTYTLTITDNTNCSASGSFVLTVLPNNLVAVASSNSPVCQGGNLNLTASPNGMSLYSWQGPNNFLSGQQNPTISNVQTSSSGNYFLTIEDANRCRATASVNVSIGSVNATAASNNPCSGETLQLTATPNGAVSYSWSGPNNFSSNQQNPLINNATALQSGTYTVTVNNGSNCVATATVVVNISTGVNAAIQVSSPTCVGSNIQLTASPLGMQTYQWSGPNNFTSSLQNPVISNATTANSGNYNLTVTNSSGCTGIATANVTVGSITATASNGGTICAGNALSLTSGPSGAASYSWSGPNGFTSTQQNPVISNATTDASGTYQVTVTTSGGCSSIASTTTTINPSPNASITTNSPICIGQTLTLEALPTGMTSYNWSGPNNFTSANRTPSITNAQANNSGNYNVTVTNSFGCSRSASASVTISGNLAISLTPNKTTLCQGETLTITASPGNLTTYAWSGPNGLTNNTAVVNITAVITANSGTYSVTGTNSSGCTGTASVNVTVNANPTVTINSNAPICEGNTLNLTGGSSGLSSYSWFGPNGFTSSLQNPTIPNATTANTGGYTLVGTNAAGCSTTVNTSLNILAAPAAVAASNSPICTGQTLELTSLPNSAASYSWSGPGNFTSSLQNPTRSNATTAMSGTYTVTITGTNNCSKTATVSTTVNASLQVEASVNSPLCAGGSIELSSTPNGAASYSWSGPNNFTSNQQNPSINNISATQNGTYTVTVTNTGGCTGTASVNVSVGNTVTASASVNSPVCEGATLNLSATPAGLSYSWSGPGGFTSNQQNPSISNATTVNAGNYAVTVTNASGCSATTNVIAVVNEKPVLTAQSNSPVCENQQVTLSAQPGNLSSYNWSGPNNFSANQSNATINNATALASGTYIVTATNSNGCSNTASISVTVSNSVQVTVTADGSLCVGESIILNAEPSGMQSYSWSGPDGFSSSQQNPVINNVTTNQSGTYSLTVTNTGGCTGTGSVQVNVSGEIQAVATVNNPLCEGSTLVLEAQPSGIANYSWSGPNNFSASTASVEIEDANSALNGLYTVTITSGNGCTGTASVFAEVIEVDAGVTQNGLTLTANNTNATYQWLDCNNNFAEITGEDNQTFAAATNGNYAVAVTENGCTQNSSCYEIIIVGLSETNDLNSYKIYPNPSMGIFNIEIYGAAAVVVYDAIGSVVHQEKVIAGKSQIDLSHLSNGIYNLQLSSNAGKVNSKIIITK